MVRYPTPQTDTSFLLTRFRKEWGFACDMTQSSGSQGWQEGRGALSTSGLSVGHQQTCVHTGKHSKTMKPHRRDVAGKLPITPPPGTVKLTLSLLIIYF